MTNYSQNVRILNPIVKFQWAGWNSDTLRLKKAGWDISVEESVLHRTIQFIIRHRAYKIYGISQELPYTYYENLRFNSGLELAILHMCSRLNITIPLQPQAFQAVETMPEIAEIKQHDIEDFKLFKTIGGKEIYLPEKSVNELLSDILEKQAPFQEELREKKHRKIRDLMRGENVCVSEKIVDMERNMDMNKNLIAQLIAVR